MHFIHHPLTWGFLLVLVPLLIHLINMLRHRRVQWAAMEFLLKSYKKHRKWIWLKQLLLLLLRMAAVFLLVAMLAKWVSQRQWFDLFGGQLTHHYVLLDDSYSMSERSGTTTAFDQAERALADIVANAGDRAGQGSGTNLLTVIRYSQAARTTSQENALSDDSSISASGSNQTDGAADFLATTIDDTFRQEFGQKQGGRFKPSSLSIDGSAALELVSRLVSPDMDQRSIIYVVSDFREQNWETPVEIRSQLQKLQTAGAEIKLVKCSPQGQPNLAISNLSAGDETQAAGVPMFVNLDVTNMGDETARQVQVVVTTEQFDEAQAHIASPADLPSRKETLPAVLIDEIAPQETVRKQIQVYFPSPGKHVVSAKLSEDSIAADNESWCVIDCPDGERTLIVDGNAAPVHGYYLETAFQPSRRVNSGIRAEMKSPSDLSSMTVEDLAKFDSVHLLDIARLDASAISTLESYVQQGGGLSYWVGENTNVNFINNQLYRDGAGLFPLPLGFDSYLAPDPINKTPDIDFTEHPVFTALLSERNPLHRLVTIERFIQPQDGWSEQSDAKVKTVAALRGGSPLVVEKRFGDGRVLAVLSTAAPQWNNLALDPTFVVVALKMHAYLASFGRATPAMTVGDPLNLQVDRAKYQEDVSFVTPGTESDPRATIDKKAAAPSADSEFLETSLSFSDTDANGLGETDRPGIYEAWPITKQGQVEVARWAYSVDSTEGATPIVANTSLIDSLEPVSVSVVSADQIRVEATSLAGFDRSQILLWILLALLIAEQMVAYMLSYHRVKGGSR